MCIVICEFDSVNGSCSVRFTLRIVLSMATRSLILVVALGLLSKNIKRTDINHPQDVLQHSYPQIAVVSTILPRLQQQGCCTGVAVNSSHDHAAVLRKAGRPGLGSAHQSSSDTEGCAYAVQVILRLLTACILEQDDCVVANCSPENSNAQSSS